MSAGRDHEISERKALKIQYGVLYESVAATLFEDDPIGLNFQENTDEYEPEAGTIIPRLTQAQSVQDVAIIIHEEFCRWFGAEDVGPIEKYKSVASKIWELWLEFKQPHA